MCFKTQKFEGQTFDEENSKYGCLVDSHENIESIASSTEFEDSTNNRISIKKGVYIFVITNDIKRFNLSRFNRISCKNIPPLGKWASAKRSRFYSLKKDQIFYVGSNKNDCIGRCFSHINCGNDSRNDNLRLKYKKRKFMKRFLKLVFIPCDDFTDEKQVEKDIRNTYFVFLGR